jgi:hypothetical protein
MSTLPPDQDITRLALIVTIFELGGLLRPYRSGKVTSAYRERVISKPLGRSKNEASETVRTPRKVHHTRNRAMSRKG